MAAVVAAALRQQLASSKAVDISDAYLREARRIFIL